jgi:hypothetical protein
MENCNSVVCSGLPPFCLSRWSSPSPNQSWAPLTVPANKTTVNKINHEEMWFYQPQIWIFPPNMWNTTVKHVELATRNVDLPTEHVDISLNLTNRWIQTPEIWICLKPNWDLSPKKTLETTCNNNMRCFALDRSKPTEKHEGEGFSGNVRLYKLKMLVDFGVS